MNSRLTVLAGLRGFEHSDAMEYRKRITIEPGKRGGKPCIRGLRITVGDVLGWLAVGMTRAEILDDYPDLNDEDIQACLEFASERERSTTIALGKG